MNLFDASALLCYLQAEPGAEVVKRELLRGGSCSAANWSETAQKVVAHGRDWQSSKALLLSYDLSIEPVTTRIAERAAAIWLERPQLSLADRLALATADHLSALVWTTDAAWGVEDPVRQVRPAELREPPQ